jgi:DNA-binding CsgD family transcriptional regulator
MMKSRHPTEDPFVRETQHFVSRQVGASASVFCWIGPGLSILDYSSLGVPIDIFENYLQGLFVHDPLNIHRLLRSERPYAFLRQEALTVSASQREHYIEYLASYQMRDEMNFVFYNGTEPFAFLCLLKGNEDPDFGLRDVEFSSLHRYVEHSMMCHPRLRQTMIARRLADSFGLTQRELEVVDCLQAGATNSEISAWLGIGVATVKSHIISILDKLGVENRTAVVAFTNQMMPF